SVDPPDSIAAGTYPIKVTASAGDQTATAELQVEIVGNVAFRFTTPDQRLSANASAGQRRDIQVLVINDGTAPITAVTLAGTAPRDWTVEFDPKTVAQIAPLNSQQVTVQLTPSGSAIAGDYNVTLTASTPDGAPKSIEMRITVDTSLSWGLIGIALILLVLVGLSWVFQRYGRR
ncbi:MAG: NEW3 domain-containing protein, partial [Chloroflexota bacterium]|nr:NEW3 domain-containing protein [Chloroflexota bacterium]